LVVSSKPVPQSGRRAEAARNDELILQSARAVFVADPGAPISAVAKHAGVGISALYKRYESKDDLLRKLAWDGLSQFVSELEQGLADDRDPWTALAGFLRRAVDADTNTLTLALAGRFTPSPELYELANRSAQMMDEMFRRAEKAGALRPGTAVHDLSMIFDQLAAIRTRSRKRTMQLRHRYLELMLDGLHDHQAEPLPGSAPTWEEIKERWA
jgi:AcrR family transcriptional regulator